MQADESGQNKQCGKSLVCDIDTGRPPSPLYTAFITSQGSLNIIEIRPKTKLQISWPQLALFCLSLAYQAIFGGHGWFALFQAAPGTVQQPSMQSSTCNVWDPESTNNQDMLAWHALLSCVRIKVYHLPKFSANQLKHLSSRL